MNETWRRFAANWRPLLAAGLFAALLQVGLNMLTTHLPASDGGLGARLQEGTLGMWGAWANGVLLNMQGGLPGLAMKFLLAPLATGALVFAAARAFQDQATGAREIWQASLRYFWRLAVIQAVTSLLTLALLGVLFASVSGLVLSGIVVAVIVLLVTVFTMGAVMVTFGYYAPYIAVAEDLGAGAALAKALRILTARWWDTLNALGVWLVLGMAEGLVQKAAGALPGIGPGLAWAATVATVPFITLYFAIRYEWNVKPMITPPGGAGTFDPNPPIGQ